MLTGQGLYLRFQQALGIAYTGQVNPVRAQRYCDRAFVQVCESNYDKDDTQKTRDNLSFLVSTNQVFNINNNQLYTSPLQINGVVISGTFGAIFTVLPHNLIVGQTVLITGVLGFSNNPNGSFTVNTILSENEFTITVQPATGTYTPNTGIVTYAEMISDYWHLFTIDAKFQKQITDFSIVDITNTSPCVVIFDWYNNISSWQQLTISGAFGNTAANGTWYVKKLTEKKAELYQDSAFQIPVTGNGKYMGGAKMYNTWYNYCKPYISNVKIGELNTPTVQDPKWEIADKLIKIWPLDETCLEVTADYLRKPIVNIDVTDNTVDLLNYYPEIFLNQVISEMQIQAAATLRDPEAYTESNQQKDRETT